MVKGTRNIYFTHFTGWLIFLSLPAVFIFSQNTSGTVYLLEDLFHWGLFAIYIAIFYLHTYWIFPKYLGRKNYPAYFFLLAVMLLLVMILQPFDRIAVHNERSLPPKDLLTHLAEKMPPSPPFHDLSPEGHQQPGPRHNPFFDIVSLALFVLVIALSLALSLERTRQKAVAKARNAEAEKTAAELALLKAQINPHFLFNTLNNIYALALMQDNNTADSILKFANIMRYVTDEAPGHMVPLQDEVKCIDDYIDLQRLRLTSNTVVQFECTGDTSTRLIAPLILITFIENAFKYGVSNTYSSVIKIILKVTESGISFSCRNNMLSANPLTSKSGVGIANTRKRLEYLYPGKHVLTITQTHEFYSISLNLNL